LRCNKLSFAAFKFKKKKKTCQGDGSGIKEESLIKVEIKHIYSPNVFGYGT
jgi:hypothetical protein